MHRGQDIAQVFGDQTGTGFESALAMHPHRR